MKIIQSSEKSDVQFIHDCLYEFNLSKTGGEKQKIVLPDTPERKAFVVYPDDGKEPVGGLAYHLAEEGRVFDVDFLWISEVLRGKGMGAELLSLAKKEAEKLDCEAIELFTNSFQAPEFYPKMGFSLIRVDEKEIPGYGLNKAYYYSMKLKR